MLRSSFACHGQRLMRRVLSWLALQSAKRSRDQTAQDQVSQHIHGPDRAAQHVLLPHRLRTTLDSISGKGGGTGRGGTGCEVGGGGPRGGTPGRYASRPTHPSPGVGPNRFKGRERITALRDIRVGEVTWRQRRCHGRVKLTYLGSSQVRVTVDSLRPRHGGLHWTPIVRRKQLASL